MQRAKGTKKTKNKQGHPTEHSRVVGQLKKKKS